MHNPNYQEIAKELLRVWQQHLLESLRDPTLAETFWQHLHAKGTPHGHAQPFSTAPDAAANATAAGLAKLSARLTKLEQRVAKLEPKPKRTRRSTAAATKRKPAKR